MILRLLWLGLLAAAPAALAQNVFTVLEGNAPQVVRAVAFNQPMIDVDGKLMHSSGTRFALRKAAAYRTGYIKISDFIVRISHLDDLGSDLNYTIEVIGHLQSDVPLKRCFIVLELTAGKNKGFIYNDLPDLPAGETRELRISDRLQERLDVGQYMIHVFSDGLELLNSKMPPLYIMQETRKTEQLMLKKLPDRAVALSRETAAVIPLYPAALEPQALVGSAKVSCRIDAQGDVVSAEVVEATHELFGAAAITAVRQWKFTPAIKDHRYVESTVIIPFQFTPPPTGDTPDKDARKP
jgi:TonB family protein